MTRSAPCGDPPDFASVLAVCAHPDDESFGLGALITTLVEHGARVDLLCLTRGEASTLGAGVDDPDPLAARRSEELHAATRELGIRRVEQRYYPDGGLANVPPCLLAAEVREAVRGHDAIIVFDEGGITGHTDHQAATTAALAIADELEMPVLAWVVPQSVAEHLEAEFDLPVTGRADDEMDCCLAVDRTRQLRAIARHASQSEVNPVVWRRLELSGDTECLRYLRRVGEAGNSSVRAVGRPGAETSEATVRLDARGSGGDTRRDAAYEVVVPRTLLDEIVDDCRRSYPAEVCGLVAGDGLALRRAMPVPNIARPEPGKCGFLMDGRVQFRAMREMEDDGLDLAGIYHSHPNDVAVPSEGDIRLAAYAEVAHLIVSLAEPARPEVRAWRIEGGEATELSIRIVDP